MAAASLESSDWYTLTPDVWLRTVAASYPQSFTSPVARALVLYGPTTGPFGVELSRAAFYGLLTTRSIAFTRETAEAALNMARQRGVFYRIAGPNRAEYIKAANQVTPFSEGGAGFGDVAGASAILVRQGPQGEPGEMGSRGPAGPQGPSGSTGARGDDGEDGDDGAAGVAGPAGATGPAGPTGATGAAGTNGTNGAAGAAGATGPAGPTGPTGPAGADGAPGASGLTHPQVLARTLGA